MTTRILNLRHHPTLRKRASAGNLPDGTVLIDRRTPWGNPFPITRRQDRDSVIRLYRQHLHEQIRTGSIRIEDLAELNGKQLLCHCAPQRCHGDVLAAAAQWASKCIAAREAGTPAPPWPLET